MRDNVSITALGEYLVIGVSHVISIPGGSEEGVCLG